MKETFNFLKSAGTYYIATINNGKPSNRPFGALYLLDNKIYTMTSKDKNVSKQIAKDNNVCIVACYNEQWIRINCSLIDDSENKEIKKTIIKENPWVEEMGYTLDNPNFQILYFEDAEATIYEDKDIVGEYKF